MTKIQTTFAKPIRKLLALVLMTAKPVMLAKWIPQRMSKPPMPAKGEVNDDYFHADLSNLRYSGWETKLIYNVLKNRLQLGIRYDKYYERYFGEGTQTDQDSLTFGCSFMPILNARLQLDYVIKTTDSETKPDIDDNILFLNFQYYFNVMPF